MIVTDKNFWALDLENDLLILEMTMYDLNEPRGRKLIGKVPLYFWDLAKNPSPAAIRTYMKVKVEQTEKMVRRKWNESTTCLHRKGQGTAHA